MVLVKMALAGVIGYGMYRYVTRNRENAAAFASGETAPGNSIQVRNAGPEAMRDQPNDWDGVDEASDESFPASDPPSTY